MTQKPGEDEAPAPEVRLVWPGALFAAVSLVVVGALSGLAIVWVLSLDLGSPFANAKGVTAPFARNDAGVAAARTDLAASLTEPLMVIGVGLVGVGLWLLVLEWRAQFVTRRELAQRSDLSVTSAGDVVSLVGALGRLKGSSLVLLTGVVLLLGPAWIGASSAGGDGSTPPATGSGTTRPTASATPSATPSPSAAASPSDAGSPTVPAESPTGRGGGQ